MPSKWGNLDSSWGILTLVTMILNPAHSALHYILMVLHDNNLYTLSLCIAVQQEKC